MINLWLDLPVFWMIVAVTLTFGLSAMAMNWLTHHSPLAARFQERRGIVAPFFTVVSLLFGLFLAFLAADVWDKKSRGHRAVIAERDALTALLKLSDVAVPEGSRVAVAVADYTRSVVDVEWPRMQDQESSTETTALAGLLLYEVALKGEDAELSAPLHDNLLRKVLRLREARADRLTLSAEGPEQLTWTAVLLLALMTQIALAAVHLERSKPQRAALAIFTISAVVAISVVAAYERPFDGPIRIAPEPLIEVISAY